MKSQRSLKEREGGKRVRKGDITVETEVRVMQDHEPRNEGIL